MKNSFIPHEYEYGRGNQCIGSHNERTDEYFSNTMLAMDWLFALCARYNILRHRGGRDQVLLWEKLSTHVTYTMANATIRICV